MVLELSLWLLLWPCALTKLSAGALSVQLELLPVALSCSSLPSVWH